MNTKKLTRLIVLMIMIGSTYMIATSGRSKNPLPPKPTTPQPAIPDKTLVVSLQSVSALPKPSFRNLPCPSYPYIGSGNGNGPAQTIYDQNKYYCLITVRNVNDNTWGVNGVKTKVWDVANPSKTTIEVQVPGGHNYKVTIDYYEVRNGFWTDNVYARGKWTTEQNFNAGYVGQWNFNQWAFMSRQ
ncbi:hypothetical protein C1637_05860 [Chryseobacterium lactis]|uniref:Uncharacterized protein n=1 Tax=Chryseobacterium lactis TaxID=1241981 RepID=A0AA91YI57_CHRLC|nr:hypothetical protein [Chryseobacterium lactis]AZA84366.1 hypothetical protein EG342_21830 [Chryseobacterium lactis]PNW14484.1 hypothetical protein C1637_05860 [Chryseobacterium lactis]